MIQLKNIERYYKSGFQKSWVLKGINLDVKQGEFITIMGDSGAGKSTLLKTLARLLPLQAGTLALDWPWSAHKKATPSSLRWRRASASSAAA